MEKTKEVKFDLNKKDVENLKEILLTTIESYMTKIKTNQNIYTSKEFENYVSIIVLLEELLEEIER